MSPRDARTAPFRATRFPSAAMRVERRADGSMIVEPELALADFVPNIPLELARRATMHPTHAHLAQRAPGRGPWIRQSYAAMKRDADALTQWLLDQRIAAGRSLLILSGNSLAHAALSYGAMGAGVPVCPVSANYALMPGDFGRLRHVVALVRPAVVYAEDAQRVARALETVDFGDATILTNDPGVLRRPAVALSSALATRPTEAVARSIDALDPDAAAFYMLTSGSTNLPKAVVQTQRMICANLAQGRQVLGDTAGWSGDMLDWLPWSHVSGAFTRLGVLTSGGTLYIDDGRPMPGAFEESLENLREIGPAFYINVPAGYAMLVPALERDAALRRRFFENLRLALYGGAGLPQPLYDRFQELAVETIGERIFFTTGYGATETSSGCMAIYFPTEAVGIGLPMPGLSLKLVPNGDRYEVRLRGPMIMRGYLGLDSSASFDDEGYYRTGDAAQLHDPTDIGRGLRFAGRLTEDFKLANGTWVVAGRLRPALIEACAPLLAETLLCGENGPYLAIAAWPSAAGRERGEALSAELAQRLRAFNAGRGSSERIARFTLLAEPPNANAHELSDKGTVNQRVAIARRAADIERLYAEPAPAGVTVVAS